MIAAEEIRLWNFVEYDGNYWQIDSINRHGSASLYREGSYSSEGVNITSCSPIPLTPEILDKFKFRKALENLKYGFVCNKDYLDIELGLVSIQIQYLHQFQNLCFALTGQELEKNETIFAK